MGGSKKQTTKTESNPWAPAQPALQQQLAGVQAYLSNPQSYQAYQGPRVAQMSDATRAGLDELALASGGRTAADYLSGVIGGDFFNPAINDLIEAVRANIAPSINSAFARAGMTGSTTHQGILAKALAQGMAQPLFQAYEADQARRLQAAGMLPSISAGNALAAIQAGQIGESYDQRNIDAARQAWEEQRMAGLRPILETLPVTTGIGGLGGTSTSQTKQSGGGLFDSILGTGMMGAAILGAPWGGSTIGGLIGTGLGNMAMGAPWSYGSSWAPWVLVNPYS